ncbi:hypothetical protein FRC01_000178 [Tulasnella sp. 417]|nr:hypothetical protein FRC01_000178 [Tulasnella sp. 417]
MESFKVNGHEIKLHKLFLVVGSSTGFYNVCQNGLWEAVGEKIGLPVGAWTTCSQSTSPVDQLCKIYHDALLDFEYTWDDSFKPVDPTAIFPLPPRLQFLRPEVENLAVIDTHIQQQEPHFEANTQESLGASARGQLSSLDYAHLGVQEQEASTHDQAGPEFYSQAGLSIDGGIMDSFLGLVPDPQSPVGQLINNARVLEVSPDDIVSEPFGAETKAYSASLYRNYQKRIPQVITKHWPLSSRQLAAFSATGGCPGRPPAFSPQPGGDAISLRRDANRRQKLLPDYDDKMETTSGPYRQTSVFH